MRRYFFLLCTTALLLIALIFAPNIVAQESNQFITVVNPVRISSYSKNPSKSLEMQYTIIKERSLPATWLITFDALNDNQVLSILKSMDQKQEMGVFLEVTPGFAKEAGVSYHNTGFWHHASSVFLSGYTQDERKLLIDSLFEHFKRKFGSYPSSVGSWWSDSYSLSYMKDKYGITANLGVSDQMATDGYSVWGQFWSTPYYPSKFHTGVPASDKASKLDVLVTQWAARDPLNGYQSSLFSTQDYQLTGKSLNTNYFEKLVRLYASKGENKFGHITVGLEADLDPEGYKGEFAQQMDTVVEFQKSGSYSVVTMNGFSSWYRNNFPDLSPSQIINTEDLLGEKRRIVWYQSSLYRIGVEFDLDKKSAKIFDLRIYDKNDVEPYYSSPNREFELFINIFSIFDKKNYDNVWKLNIEPNELNFSEGGFTINKNIDVPGILSINKFIEITKTTAKTEIQIKDETDLPKDGVEYKDYSAEAMHFFRSKGAVLNLLTGKGWKYFNKISYNIPQEEYEALFFLANLPEGRVLVYDNECLQCEWHGIGRPAVFSNARKYIGELGRKSVVKNRVIFESRNLDEIKKAFRKTNVKYIYLAKLEDYIEKLPVSPGDLNVEKIFENANAEIWRVK